MSAGIGDPTSGGAQDALARGEQALRAGRHGDAERWLDRAWRLAPGDAAAGLLLASALLPRDPARAMQVLRAVQAAGPDRPDVRLALALACRHASGEHPEHMLAAMLARYAPPRGAAFRAFADSVAAQAGTPGWAGADAAGRLTISLTAPGPAALRIAHGEHVSTLHQTRRRATHRLDASWQQAASLDLSRDGHQLLGSPLDWRALRRVEGLVRAEPDGGASICAWVAGDPHAVPRLSVRCGGRGRRLRSRAARGFAGAPDFAGTPDFAGAPDFARVWHVAPDPTAAPLHVLDDRGCDLPGSPILRRPPPPAAIAAPPPRCVPKPAEVDVVIPVWQGVEDLAACLASLRRGLPDGARIVLVDDASPDARLQDFLAGPGLGEAIVLRQARRGGFPAAANAGLRFAAAAGAPRDVVLLNPDTLLPVAGIARLARAAYADPATGSVTPMSDDGSIVSCDLAPLAARPDAAPTPTMVDRIDAWCAAANPDRRVALPTGIGFCLFLRHDCLAATGLLREEVFAHGYGEENDWCRRATAGGWRHVAETGLFVHHAGGRSFGAARAVLTARNADILAKLHPGYESQVRAFRAADPLRPARRRAAAVAWAAAHMTAGAAILVTHALGGGTEQHVVRRAAELSAQGLRAIVLRLSPGPDGTQLCTVADGPRPASAELTFALPRALPDLAALLRDDHPRWLELHHCGGLKPDIIGLSRGLDIPCDVVVHDYAMLCPRVTFCDADGQYCGEPVEIARCESCVATHGSRLHETIAVADLRRRTVQILRGARQVAVACEDVARRLRRYAPGLATTLAAWEEPARPAARARPADGTVRVCILGALGRDKGFDVLLRCAEDAAAHDRALDFTVVGHTIDDARLLATGRVFVTGRFDRDEAEALVRAQDAALGLVPSVCPETWSFALSTLWRAGLPVVCFDLGAPAERIRRTGGGWVVPLGTPAARLNALLLHFASLPGRAAA